MWRELDEALVERRPRDALRHAVGLWRETRDAGLADLIDALAAFVDSDPRTAPTTAPDEPADLDGWLGRMADAAGRIFEGEWWARDWQQDVLALAANYAAVDDPRVATEVASFVLDPFVLHNIGDVTPFVAVLTELRDGRVRARMTAQADVVGGGRTLRALANLQLVPPEPLDATMRAVVERGLARYRDEPQRFIDLILDPRRERDDGTEQVASDALSEMGHPYGEAIALEYDAAAGIISAAGRERLATLMACHERRWLGRALYLSTKNRVYRGGLLDEAVLVPRPKDGALEDPRLSRLRILRADGDDWDVAEAEMLRASPWLGALEEMDVPSFELLGGLTANVYPKLRRIRLGRLRPIRHADEWNHWPQPLAAWREKLPALEEVVFRSLPEEGLEGLIEGIVAENLHERIEAFSIDGTRAGWSWVRSGERDITMWFRRLDPYGIKRAALYYTDATFAVSWTPDGLVVTLETSEGGPAFDLLRRLPARRVARITFRDFPKRRPRRLAKLGRLRRFLDGLRGAEVDMPLRWKNQLARA